MSKISLIFFIIALTIIATNSKKFYGKKTLAKEIKNIKLRLETGKNPAEQEKRNEKRNAIISDENDQECCTKSRFESTGQCCCRWLKPDYSEFPFIFTKELDENGNDVFWTCGNNCEYGFKCSN